MATHSQRLFLVVGMCTSWLPVVERLLYPISFTSGDKNSAIVYLLNTIYYIAAIGFTLTLAVISSRLKQRTLNPKAEGLLLLVTGLGAAIGIFAVWTVDVATLEGSVLATLSMILVALYVPVHFIFWSACYAQSTSRYLLSDAMLSFALCAALFALYGALDLRVVSLAGASPVISAVLAFTYIRRYSLLSSEQLQFKTLWKTSNLTISLVLLLLCNVAIVYFNNSARLHADIPYRWISFCADIAIALIIAALYWPNTRWRRPTMLAFSVVAVISVCSLLSAVLMSDSLLQRGTISLHCMNAVMIAFIWLMIVRVANRQKLSLVSIMALYLAVGVLIPRFVQALNMYGESFVTQYTQSMNPTTVVAAIVILAVGAIIFVLTKELNTIIDDKTNLEKNNDVASDLVDGATLGLSTEYINEAHHAAGLEEALLVIQKDAALSAREMDVARLSLRNYSAKKMADTFFVSVNTIYSHMKSIYRKTGVHSREEFISLVERVALKH